MNVGGRVVAKAGVAAVTFWCIACTHVPTPNDANTYVAHAPTAPPQYVAECVPPHVAEDGAGGEIGTGEPASPAAPTDQQAGEPLPQSTPEGETAAVAGDGAAPSPGLASTTPAAPAASDPVPPPSPAPSTGGGESTTTSESAPTPPPPEPAPSGPGRCTPPPREATAVTVQNDTDDLICYVHFTQGEGRRSWGEDRLGAAEVIAPGESRDVRVPAGTWRVRLADCNRTAVYQREALEVPEAGGRIHLRVRE